MPDDPRPAPAVAWCATTSRRSSATTAGSSASTARARSATRGSASGSATCRRSPASTARRPSWTARSTRRRRSWGGARMPLVYGLGQTTCEAQRVAVALAETIGAVIDSAGPLLDGASGLAFQARGASTATLGDVRDRADVVVIWRADPATTHPRLLERLRLPDANRELIVVDERRTATAEEADTFIELPADRDVEALWTLRALVREAPVASDAPLDDLAARLRGSRSAAILHHVRGQVEALGLQRARPRPLPGHARRHRDAPPRGQRRRRRGRARVADRVPVGRELRERVPALEPGRAERGGRARARRRRRGARRRLRSARASAASRPPTTCARSPSSRSTSTARRRPTRRASRSRPPRPGCTGAGVVHRLDGVPIPLRALLESSRPSDEDVLQAIAGRLA